MDVTQLALTWVGLPNGEKIDLSANLISTKVSASYRKSTQVHARPGQTKLQEDPGFQLTCVYLRLRLARAFWPVWFFGNW